MKKIFIFLLIIGVAYCVEAQVNTGYLWNYNQPIYWPEKSKAQTYTYQKAKESYDLFVSGDAHNIYSDGLSHPFADIFSILSNTNLVEAYQTVVKNSVSSIMTNGEAGIQFSYTGVLSQNVNSLADAQVWGYDINWQQNFIDALSWQTSGGYPRADAVGTTFSNSLAPLLSERVLTKEIQAQKFIYSYYFGVENDFSKGFWPPEAAFSERIIKVLVQEGFDWSVVPNSHLARTLADYPTGLGPQACNTDFPNRADKISTLGINWWSAEINGIGGSFSSPFCYQAHKAKYIDPETGLEYKINIVPMSDFLSYKDSYQGVTISEIVDSIAPFNDNNQNSIVLLAHYGDRNFASTPDYYNVSVPDFVQSAYENPILNPTTVQQFLFDNPVPETDLVHVEDGASIIHADDGGHPQFVNWIQPLFDSSSNTFDPEAWNVKSRNWALVTAAENYVLTAEDLSGGVVTENVVFANELSSNAELAWHFFMPALSSDYFAHADSADNEVKQTITLNHAINYAKNQIELFPGQDNTPPSVLIPQRFPYNPGSRGYGPVYDYNETVNSKNFTVWTYAFDVSGIASAILKYREDEDGLNPLADNINELYIGGNGVKSWNENLMTEKILSSGNVSGDTDIDFFVLPESTANLYYAEISEFQNKLIDYYVEMTDAYGNVFKSPIQHVFVGNDTAYVNSQISITPQNPTKNDIITISCPIADAQSFLQWGVNIGGSSWNLPVEEYWPQGTVAFDSHAVRTPFADIDGDGLFEIHLGPFNNAAQLIDSIDLFAVINQNTIDNNSGNDYHIPIQNSTNSNPVGANTFVSTLINEPFVFSQSIFYFFSEDFAEFAGIRIMHLPDNGNLLYDSQNVTPETDYNDIRMLSFLPGVNESGNPYTTFEFKIIDNQGRYSDNAYTMTIAVNDFSPHGANAAVSMLVDENYYFSINDFYFESAIQTFFNGIKLSTVQNNGTLLYDGSPVDTETDYNSMYLLQFIPEPGESGMPYSSFTFKIKDNEGNYSLQDYRMDIYVVDNSLIPEGVSWTPEFPDKNDAVMIFVKNDENMNQSSKLNWAVNGWQMPINDYFTENTLMFDIFSVENSFRSSDNIFYAKIGPFNSNNQLVDVLNFKLHYDANNWNDNFGENWQIFISNDVTDLKNNLIEDEILLYPNPSSGFTSVEIKSDKNSVYDVILSDITGRQMQKLRINSREKFIFNMNNLPKGLYLLSFYDITNNILTTKKLIKH